MVKKNKIFVIEDGSTDGTSEKLKELSKVYEITLSQSESRRGYSKALLKGISMCEAEFVFFSDLGGKFNWDDINKLIKKIPANDLVIGKREDRNDQIYRRLLTFFYSKYILFFYGIKSGDPDSGFRIYRKELILEILKNEPQHRQKLWENVKALQSGLVEHGFDIGTTKSCVTPVFLKGDVLEAMVLVKDLREKYNIFCSIVVYPVIPKGLILLRLIPTAAHTMDDINETLNSFLAIRDKLQNGYYKKISERITA